jgi:hypothetical protein
MKGRTFFIVVTFLGLLAAFSACQSPLSEPLGYYRMVGADIVEGQGTVIFVGIEGGFYGITTGKDGHWDPINLPSGFEQDGLKVKFRAKLRNDLLSFHMWGRIIELISIEKI